ncbi:hypothetical protein IT570_04750 [Candidatus Sumerlaeota bacterium]|nr:hypothetical protein [Candidatus Sumerlaeota bacterium]
MINRGRVHDWLVAVTVYTLLTFAAYFPGILQLFNAPLAWFEGAGIYYRIWWYNEVVRGGGDSIWFLPNILPPHGMPTMLQSNGIGRELLFAFLGGHSAPQLIGNLFGVSVPLTVALMAFGVLRRLLRGAFLPALVGGWLCGWSGSVVTHIATPWMSSCEGLVAFIGCLLMMRRGRNLPRIAVLAGIAAAVAAWFQIQLLTHVLLVTGVFIVDRAWKKDWRAIGWVCVSGVIGAVLSAPLLHETWKAFGGDLNSMGGDDPIDDMYQYRNTVAEVLFSPTTGRLTGWITTLLHNAKIETQPLFTAYLGLVVSLLGIIGVWSRKQGTGFLLAVAVTCVLMSFGPIISLNWGGSPDGPLFGRTWIPGPFYLIKDLPVMNSMRTPGRLMLGAQVSMALLAGFGVLHLLRNRALRRRATIVAAALIALHMIDVNRWPTKFAEPQYSKFWEQIAQEPGDFAVLDVPYMRGMDNYMHYGAYHHKRVLWGYGGRVPAAMYQPLESDLKFALVTTDFPDRWPKDVDRFAANLLKYHVKYIILHEVHLNLSPESRVIGGLFTEYMNDPKTWVGQSSIQPPVEVYHDDVLRAWEIRKR